MFISYSSRDAFIASVMKERVESLGAEVWLDSKDVEGGDIVSDTVRRGIEACDEAIVLVSPSSRESQWVLFEIGAIWGRKKRVTPILMYVGSDAIKPMRDVKAFDINDFDLFQEQLKGRIKRGKPSRSS